LQDGQCGWERWLMSVLDASHALEHVGLELLENRSFDNVVGRFNR
jgi:hypothetical protein